MEAWIDGEIAKMRQKKAALFRISEKNAADQEIWTNEALQNQTAINACFTRWFAVLHHYDFPVAKILLPFEDGGASAPPSDEELDRVISDFDSSFYKAMATFLP